LRAARQLFDGWPDELASVRGRLETAVTAVLAAFDGLRGAPDQAEGIRAVFRALRYIPRAKEALYPLAGAVLRSIVTFSIPRYATMPKRRRGSPRRHRTAPASCMSITSPAAAVAIRSTCRNLYARLRVAAGDGAGMAAAATAATFCGRGSGRTQPRRCCCRAHRHRPTWALMGEDTDTPNLNRILDW